MRSKNYNSTSITKTSCEKNWIFVFAIFSKKKLKKKNDFEDYVVVVVVVFSSVLTNNSSILFRRGSASGMLALTQPIETLNLNL